MQISNQFHWQGFVPFHLFPDTYTYLHQLREVSMFVRQVKYERCESKGSGVQTGDTISLDVTFISGHHRQIYQCFHFLST